MTSISGRAFVLLPAVWLLAGCASSPGLMEPPSAFNPDMLLTLAPPSEPMQVQPPAPVPETTPIQAPDILTTLQQMFERYQGTPYRYGGTTARGFDCSGFITTVYREGLGQNLPRSTKHMLQSGQAVDPEQIRPGDLVFFRIRRNLKHAGIYMGNGQFIHSSTSVGVTMSSLTSNYWQDRFIQARRYTRQMPVTAQQR